MNFSEVYNLILESCPFLSGNLYDGIIVKKLAATNTISDTGSSHQSHMAFTGKQKDFFPFLEADGYFNVGYDNKDDDLKKYFTLRIPLNIYADNVKYLSDTTSPIQFESMTKRVRASVLRSRRKGQEDQVELSIKSLDDTDFIEFRKLLRVNDFFILLKKKNVLEYDLIGIKGDDKNSAQLATCTDFYKGTTQTPVDIDLFASAKEFSKVQKTSSPFSPTQIIYYGVPGCGKSHTVDAEINKSISEYNKGKDESDKISYEKQVIRVVFHPDYGNSDFIGQIMPKLRERGGVDYVFKPGPLAQILRMAYLNSDKPYFLVVEEINRGNAAAIFGETFQLLDRIKDGKKDKNGYGPGWSSYSILNDDVNDYIRDIKAYENFEHSGCVKTNHPKDMINGDGNPVDAPDVNGHKEIDFSTATSYCSLELILQGFDCPQTFRESTAIRLPPNLSIYATMNTSDQNVFTLDNAFQRRWEMKQVPNDLKDKIPANASEEEKKNIQAEIDQYNEIIGNANVKWGDFRKAVNEVIMDSAQANGLSSMEDKRLGGWFFTPPDNFAEKVLKYLWDDAFKFDRPNQFTGFKTLEELVTNFNTAGFKVFKDDRISKLQKDSSTTPDGAAQNNTPVVDG